MSATARWHRTSPTSPRWARSRCWRRSRSASARSTKRGCSTATAGSPRSPSARSARSPAATSCAPRRSTIAITIVGEVRPSNLKTRAGMLPGDAIAVTGPLGASRAGLAVAVERPELASDPAAEAALRAFRTPEPRLAEGRWLAASRNVRAMMDTSDGLSTDLARLARASNAGATIETIPVAGVRARDRAARGRRCRSVGARRRRRLRIARGGRDARVLASRRTLSRPLRPAATARRRCDRRRRRALRGRPHA